MFFQCPVCLEYREDEMIVLFNRPCTKCKEAHADRMLVLENAGVTDNWYEED